MTLLGNLLQELWDKSALIFLVVCLGSLAWGVVAAIVRGILGHHRSIAERRVEEVEAVARERRVREKANRTKKKQSVVAHKYAELVQLIADLNPACSGPWDEIRRTAEAFGGRRLQSLTDVVMNDVLAIMSVFSTAKGDVPNRLGFLYQAISRRWLWRPPTTEEECLTDIREFERNEISLPSTIQIFHNYDEVLKTRLASRVADAYYPLVIAAAELCGTSFAVCAVQAEYLRLLEPYLTRPRIASDVTICSHCHEAYRLLELPLGASRDAISDARREFAKDFHPDAWANRRGARVAEDQIKLINAACDHLLACDVSHAKGGEDRTVVASETASSDAPEEIYDK